MPEPAVLFPRNTDMLPFHLRAANWVGGVWADIKFQWQFNDKVCGRETESSDILPPPPGYELLPDHNFDLYYMSDQEFSDYLDTLAQAIDVRTTVPWKIVRLILNDVSVVLLQAVAHCNQSHEALELLVLNKFRNRTGASIQ